MNRATVLSIVLRCAIVPLLMFLIVAPTIAIWYDRNTGATILASIAIAAILLTRLPDVDEFSSWGIKAKLDKAVQEAEVTIEQMRNMAVAFAEANLGSLAAVGLITTPITLAGRVAIRDRIVGSLREIEVSDSEILRVQIGWRSVFCSFYFSQFQSALLLHSQAHIMKFIRLPVDPVIRYPGPEEIRGLIKEL
jgi:hypothetical protein